MPLVLQRVRLIEPQLHGDNADTSHGLELRSDALGSVGLENIPWFNVLEIRDCNTALKALLDFAGVVLKALQRLDPARVDNDVVAKNANLTVASDGTFDDHAT